MDFGYTGGTGLYRDGKRLSRGFFTSCINEEIIYELLARLRVYIYTTKNIMPVASEILLRERDVFSYEK